jgi:hypothetical protein
VAEFWTLGSKRAPMEIGTKENMEVVNRVWEYVFEAQQNHRHITDEQRSIYEVENLAMEVNSGASYEQYFRFATIEEISGIVLLLEKFEFFEVAKLTKQAIDVAYPNGIPQTNKEKDYLPDWSEAQDVALREFGHRFTDYNGRICNTLADYARQVGA